MCKVSAAEDDDATRPSSLVTSTEELRPQI
jgi:hypothetical protein